MKTIEEIYQASLLKWKPKKFFYAVGTEDGKEKLFACEYKVDRDDYVKWNNSYAPWKTISSKDARKRFKEAMRFDDGSCDIIKF